MRSGKLPVQVVLRSVRTASRLAIWHRPRRKTTNHCTLNATAQCTSPSSQAATTSTPTACNNALTTRRAIEPAPTDKRMSRAIDFNKTIYSHSPTKASEKYNITLKLGTVILNMDTKLQEQQSKKEEMANDINTGRRVSISRERRLPRRETEGREGGRERGGARENCPRGGSKRRPRTAQQRRGRGRNGAWAGRQGRSCGARQLQPARGLSMQGPVQRAGPEQWPASHRVPGLLYVISFSAPLRQLR